MLQNLFAKGSDEMIKHLYDSFARNWYRGGNVWFYSDPHFSDDEMIFLRKNYIGDEEQVKRINAKISKNDTLVILGDVGNPEFVKKLRGYKVLIKGNHDRGNEAYADCFDEIYEGIVLISQKIILSHEPVDFPYAFNIHGHDHSDWYHGKAHLNCCAEHINYTPICLSHIVKSGCLKNLPDIHRETIDHAAERKRIMDESLSPSC